MSQESIRIEESAIAKFIEMNVMINTNIQSPGTNIPSLSSNSNFIAELIGEEDSDLEESEEVPSKPISKPDQHSDQSLSSLDAAVAVAIAKPLMERTRMMDDGDESSVDELIRALEERRKEMESKSLFHPLEQFDWESDIQWGSKSDVSSVSSPSQEEISRTNSLASISQKTFVSLSISLELFPSSLELSLSLS